MEEKIYWSPHHILPYQRRFNLINAPRSVGKTYGTIKYFFQRYLKKKEEFAYIVRTDKEKQSYAISKACDKVAFKEFENEICLEEKSGILYNCILKGGKIVSRETMGHCLALSMYEKIKKESFPRVRWGIFDEYMKERDSQTRYVNGFREPDCLLSLYQTIDRDEDKLILFMLGNNTSFYNPYHIHPAFNIQPVDRGKIFLGKNVLFENYQESDELIEKKKANLFNSMISGTKYGKYADKGDYTDDNYDFIGKRPSASKYIYAISYMGNVFGVWADYNTSNVYISKDYNRSTKLIFALTLESHAENTLLTKTRTNNLISWLAKNFRYGNVKFEDMEVKVLSEGIFNLIL